MIDSKLRTSSVLADQAELTTNPSMEGYVQEISELADWRVYFGLGENFRGAVANLFCRILELEITDSGEDPALFTEGTWRSAQALAFSFTHRFMLDLNQEIATHFRTEYPTMIEKIIAEYLPVAMSQFLSELGYDVSGNRAGEESLPLRKES